jgi:DNA polymerase
MSENESNNTELLRQIRDEVINLTESPLYEYRKKNNYYPVLGQGNHHADIMFIGEAPGKNEAEQGRPFCGAAGRVLDELLESIGLNREEVYVTNIVKDRPPDNRDPVRAEIDIYSPFLVRQINIIKPKVIATLGRFSMEFILKLFDASQQKEKISKLHGQVIKAQAEYGEISIVPLYHPAAALYSQKQRPVHEEDFKVLKQFMS